MRLTSTFLLHCSVVLILVTWNPLLGQGSLPLFSIEEMQFIGAFRLPADEFGFSSLNYSQGPVEYNDANHSIYIVGHSHHQAIAEFAIPDLVTSEDLTDLEVASPPLQLFASVLDEVNGGNAQSIDRIGGMELLYTGTGQELVVNAYEYYDAPADNTHSHLVIRDATDLANSTVNGYYAHNGGAGHTSGWMSPIPPVWQSALGGTHITGQSSGIPIIGRTSVGPSAFAFSKDDLIGTTVDPTPTTTLLDFSLDHPLHDDLSNSGGANDLWTHLSQVTYGMIVPGTSTYLTIGHSGGHNSGVCYKCTQSDENLCGGYCAPDADDYDQYYWLWDINDLLAVKNGDLASFDVRPYDYGPLTVPHSNGRHEVGGGTFDPDQGTLYLSLQRADTTQGIYANPPVIIAFDLSRTVLPIELISFEAELVDEEVHLIWKTAHEVDNAGFDVEMNAGEGWTSIGFVVSMQNGAQVSTYEWKVPSPLVASSSFRLKQIDVDGDYVYSPIETVNFVGKDIFEVFPNPSLDKIDIRLRFSQTLDVSISLFNTLGNKVYYQEKATMPQDQERILCLNLTDLASGHYFLKVQSDRKTLIKKVIIE